MGALKHFSDVVHALHEQAVHTGAVSQFAVQSAIDWIMYNQKELPEFCRLDLSSTAIN